FDKVDPVHIRHKTECQSAIGVVLERFISHYRPEIRAADADVDDISDALTRVTFPFTAPDAVRKVRHFIEHAVDFGHDVLAIYHGVPRRAKSDMQDWAVLRNVYLLTTEHRIDSRAQITFFRQFEQ